MQWTEDGTGIAFLAKRGDDKTNALYLIPVDGGEARKAAELASDISTYSLAPDGKRVALVASEPLAAIEEETSGQRIQAEIYEEDWRTRQKSGWRHFLKKRPTPGRSHSKVTSINVRWSPVDDRLLVAVAPTPSVDDSMTRQNVQVVDGRSGQGSRARRRTWANSVAH